MTAPRPSNSRSGVLRRFAEHGIAGVCLTPHLLASTAARGVPELQDRQFAALLPVAPPEVTLYRGAEVMLDRPLDARVAAARQVTINGSRYILVEFSRLVAAQTVEHALALVVAIGLVPLVAHPERYRCCHPDAVRRWKALGALMQVDGPTLLSPRPRGVRARSWWSMDWRISPPPTITAIRERFLGHGRRSFGRTGRFRLSCSSNRTLGRSSRIAVWNRCPR